MDIEIKIKMKLPDECKKMTKKELRSLIYDEYINFVTCQHHFMAVDFGAKGMIGTDKEVKSLCEISKYHTMWGHITASPKFEVTVDDGFREVTEEDFDAYVNENEYGQDIILPDGSKGNYLELIPVYFAKKHGDESGFADSNGGAVNDMSGHDDDLTVWYDFYGWRTSKGLEIAETAEVHGKLVKEKSGKVYLKIDKIHER